LTLTLLTTLAASFIWGINTLFLLDAGLSNAEAFAANAFFTAGSFLFEVPTGVVADTRGRRTSFLLGTITLVVSTLLYLLMWQIHAPLWGWAIASVLLGLGFTFFSGAVEAWLVDALRYTGYSGAMDPIFGRGQVVAGAAMLMGSVAGGFIAQATNLGVPYIIRAVILVIAFVVGVATMRDLGFTPKRGSGVRAEIKTLLKGAIESGFGNRPIRWLMLAAPFQFGVGIFAFYAMQPYLLELYGDPTAFGIAGMAAALTAGAQIAGGLLVSKVLKLFKRRTDLLLTGALVSVAALALIGLVKNFWAALAFITAWAALFSLEAPVRQAYINNCIPSDRRATVLSFDALMGSSGGVVFQPVLGRVADIGGYSASYLVGSVISAVSVPFVWFARREKAPGDLVVAETADAA
jgi:MFS family permease